jgi:hypothetical protein
MIYDIYTIMKYDTETGKAISFQILISDHISSCGQCALGCDKNKVPKKIRVYSVTLIV